MQTSSTQFTLQDEIDFWNDRIKFYQKELEKNANDSLFYRGMIKNAKELLEEIKDRNHQSTPYHGKTN